MSTEKKFELRCPVYGFVSINEWERDIINQPAFQRLRRIKQLGFTDYIYPGALHSRFEHSLGVMHMASLVHDQVTSKSRELLSSKLDYNDAGLSRNKAIVRLAALLHDVGHSPFSHAGENLFPSHDSGHYRHEDYSAAIIRNELKDVIEEHKNNVNYGIKADEVANILDNLNPTANSLFWREIIDGQIDSDRMDYLLRDSVHTGVNYGKYDWQRIINTIEAVEDPESENLRLGVSEGGWHAAEGLVLARYFMFAQIYFHKTRVVYDHHIQEALKKILPEGTYPEPTETGIKEYIKWDDWKVFGYLSEGRGDIHGDVLLKRKHFR
ncbi:MAG: HD domain-containing protein [bacterium]|nr:HD domain-containing protein [bacterium]